MSDLPIQNLLVSDFRRLEGTRKLPFDAPVVLIYGANGTGKTSVLAALELALTGGIRSMERQDGGYASHLPFLGQASATVRAEVAQYLQAGSQVLPMTVDGSGIKGPRALNDKAAQFYSERCFLDQASLGRLLEFYQARVGNEESALAKFISELLGLEKLDALRDGLSDANDLRLLKKLAAGIEEAANKAKLVVDKLKYQTDLLSEIRKELAEARAATHDALVTLDPAVTADVSDTELLTLAQSTLVIHAISDAPGSAEEILQELVALGGRISAVSDRPTSQRIHERRTALDAALAEHRRWDAKEGAAVRAWDEAAIAAGVSVAYEPGSAISHASNIADNELANFVELISKVESVRTKLDGYRIKMRDLENRIANAHEHSSALVEGLTALRALVDDNNVCPVCDRNYTEISTVSLRERIECKLSDLTLHGQQLLDLRTERKNMAATLAREEGEYRRLSGLLLTFDEQEVLERRQGILRELAAQADEMELARSHGADLMRRVRECHLEVEALEAAASESRHISVELDRYAVLLEVDPITAGGPLEGPWRHLLGHAEAEVGRIRKAREAYRTAALESKRFTEAMDRAGIAIQSILELTEQKIRWESRVAEAKRRQTVAKEVHDAATRARTTIVQRVFTESLNDVWKSVFTRLAPSEGFIPKFGIPTATKKALDIKLETTHRSGVAGGPPQMMLSAGNLNTAALSLFLALHLAVQPVMPCLVFDDPVQAMDEVHVAQFAGLIRVLAKQHNRQVVIAVHERELFDYLALELSPAYEGDELITIELGERAYDEDEGIIRHTWKPDIAIAS